MKPVKKIIDSDQLYLNNNEEARRGEINLWRAVVKQSLDDFLLPDSNNKYRIWREQAIQWFVEADEDFYIICKFANLSAEKILESAYRNIAKIKIDHLD